ncbi:glycosyltransferase family 87 protein [Actinacidiphila acididurans]|uniref:DUF2029 domain-containing protein n=1 Tax=Actinacidiphila acididurans TaxID=2784346 RepID=A0ABS2TY26_9ACTN|nr:glycosyltransferase family 87 protein [Actinacidiphila acididurans]MBM9508245.1 DUF2029 domain-containing protein [Actinacidiphila acididurans]
MQGNAPASSPLEDSPAPRRPIDAGRESRGPGRVLGISALVCCAGATLLMITSGALGPSSTEPVFGSTGLLPPWFRRTDPPDLLVCALVTLVLALGTATVIAGLAAVRRQWSPRPRTLLLCGALAVAGLLCVPPVGTTDPLNYAVYGRMATLGTDPYRTTPWEFGQGSDPIGQLALAEPWLHYPSVYGPLVTATEWAASLAGGTSMLRTVWLLSVLNGAAFVATGALLLKLAGPDPARRVRSQLLWTLNPVLMWNLVAGPHIDALGALCVVAAFWALRRSGLTTGLLLGAAAAVKITLGILVLPFAWSMRHDRRRLVAVAAGGVLVLAVGYGLTPHAVLNAARVSGESAVGSPWPLMLRKLLVPVFGAAGGKAVMALLEIALVAVLVVLLRATLPPAADGDIAQRAARPALVLVAAYLLGTAYVRPWYDALAWVLVALVPRSWFDPVLLAHTTLMTVPFIPGLPQPLHPHILNVLALQTGYRIVPALQVLLLCTVLYVCARRIRRGRGAGQPLRPLAEVNDG